MATPKQFAIQQVLNLLLRRPADKSIIAYLDNLKTSGLENTMEMTYPQGGRGNVYIGAGFAHSKRATLNVETATWNTNVMAVQNGTEVITGDTEIIEYDVISYVSGEGFKTKFPAIGNEHEEIGFLYILNPDGTQGNVYTQTDSLRTDNTQFLYVPPTRTISFTISEQQALIDSNVKLCCAYKRMTTGDKAQKISLTGTSIPAVVLVTGYGVVVDICSNVAYLCQFNGKAQVDGNYTFDLSADGDPSVQSLNLEFVRDCGVEELYSFVIYDDDDNGEEPSPPTPPTPTKYVIHSLDGEIVNSNVVGNLDYSFELVEGDVWEVTATSPVLEEPVVWSLTVTTYTDNANVYNVLRSQANVEFWVWDNAEANTNDGTLTPMQGSTAFMLQDMVEDSQILEATLTFTKVE